VKDYAVTLSVLIIERVYVGAKDKEEAIKRAKQNSQFSVHCPEIKFLDIKKIATTPKKKEKVDDV